MGLAIDYRLFMQSPLVQALIRSFHMFVHFLLLGQVMMYLGRRILLDFQILLYFHYLLVGIIFLLCLLSFQLFRLFLPPFLLIFLLFLLPFQLPFQLLFQLLFQFLFWLIFSQLSLFSFQIFFYFLQLQLPSSLFLSIFTLLIFTLVHLQPITS